MGHSQHTRARALTPVLPVLCPQLCALSTDPEWSFAQSLVFTFSVTCSPHISRTPEHTPSIFKGLFFKLMAPGQSFMISTTFQSLAVLWQMAPHVCSSFPLYCAPSLIRSREVSQSPLVIHAILFHSLCVVLIGSSGRREPVLSTAEGIWTQSLG